MANNSSEALHVAILPWLAFGHMFPFLHLAVALASAGLRVSFLSTPGNTKRLPKVPSHLSSLIKFIDLPLPSVDGLPVHAEATVDISFSEVQYLKIAYDSLRKDVRQFVEDESPDYILHDFLPYWIVDIGREFNVPCVFFSVFTAAALTFFGPSEAMSEGGRKRWWPSPKSMMEKPEWVSFPSTVAFRQTEAEIFYRWAFDVNASGVSDIDRLRLSTEGCTFVAVRSCNEYEGVYLELLERLHRKPVIPVGLLPPEQPLSEKSKGGKIFEWLDKQKPRSVVFVSFGSELKLSEKEVHELAHGLELSSVPFLWALRRPAWVAGQDEEALPQGFVGRTAGRGLVSFGWAPQLEILGHPSVGGSFFHSGWGSVIETLRHGHALVVLPTIYDQGLNARLLVQKGLAIEVEKDDEDGSFDRNKIADSLVTAMISNEGEEMRVKAKEMGTIFADQALHDRYVKGFIDYLLKSGNKSDT